MFLGIFLILLVHICNNHDRDLPEVMECLVFCIVGTFGIPNQYVTNINNQEFLPALITGFIFAVLSS